MRSFLPLTLAIMFVLAIIHAPSVESRAVAGPEADALADADAAAMADPLADADAAALADAHADADADAWADAAALADALADADADAWADALADPGILMGPLTRILMPLIKRIASFFRE